MLIPHASLAPETLQSLIEEFVTRDGAIHGHTDTPTSAIIDSILHRLNSGQVVIVFDEQTESCTIVTKEDWQKIARGERE